VAAVFSSRGMKPKSVTRVAIRPLAAICREQNIASIDFLSIDVEGMDFQVLHTLDWNIVPTVIAIEDSHFDFEQPENSAVFRELTGRGYKLYGATGPTLIFKHD
jgi:hypothetical protein